MSRSSYEAGLRGRRADAGWTAAELADYERGALLGEQDVRSRLAMYDHEPIARDLDEIEPVPPGGHVIRRESAGPLRIVEDCEPIAASKWPSAAVEALYTPAQYRSERSADGDGEP